MTDQKKRTLWQEINWQVVVGIQFLVFFLRADWRRFWSVHPGLCRKLAGWGAVAVAVPLVVIAALWIPPVVDRWQRVSMYDAMGEHIRACERDADRCEKVVEFYRTRCEWARDGEACWLLGLHHRTGHGVERDDLRAAELFRLACDYGEAVGCRLFGEAGDGGSSTSVEHRLFSTPPVR